MIADIKLMYAGEWREIVEVKETTIVIDMEGVEIEVAIPENWRISGELKRGLLDGVRR